MEQNAVIADVSSVPLMTLLVCMYWTEMQAEEIPNRIDKLYDAIFNIMYAHLQSKKKATHEKNTKPSIALTLLKQRLGKMALDGLWPPENSLVFSVDEVSDPEVVEEACNMGLLSKQEEWVRTRRLLTPQAVQTGGKPKLTFFHKSAQEKMWGRAFCPSC